MFGKSLGVITMSIVLTGCEVDDPVGEMRFAQQIENQHGIDSTIALALCQSDGVRCRIDGSGHAIVSVDQSSLAGDGDDYSLERRPSEVTWNVTQARMSFNVDHKFYSPSLAINPNDPRQIASYQLHRQPSFAYRTQQQSNYSGVVNLPSAIHVAGSSLSFGQHWFTVNSQVSLNSDNLSQVLLAGLLVSSITGDASALNFFLDNVTLNYQSHPSVVTPLSLSVELPKALLLLAILEKTWR